MINKIKFMLAGVLMLGVFVAPISVSAAVSETPNIGGSLCGGADFKFDSNGDCATNGGNSEEKLNGLIAKVVNILSVIVAVVAVIMIIVGGFKYIASGGDSTKVTGAKNTILYAIIGLVIVALAQFVVKFVLTKATDTANG